MFLRRKLKQLPKTSIFSLWSTQHYVPGRRLKVRLDWTRSEGWRPSRVVAYVTREGCQSSQVVANLRDWSLYRLILIPYLLDY